MRDRQSQTPSTGERRLPDGVMRYYTKLPRLRAPAKPRTPLAERMRRWFAATYGVAELADRVAVVGNAEECAEHVRGLLDAGVDHVILNPTFDECEQMEALAQSVIPAVGLPSART